MSSNNVRRSYTHIHPDRSQERVTEVGGKEESRKPIEGKFIADGSATLDFGIKRLKRAGAPKQAIRDYKNGVWSEYLKRVENKLKEQA